MANTSTPAVRQVHVFTMQVIKASLKCHVFCFKMCLGAYVCVTFVFYVRVVGKKKTTISPNYLKVLYVLQEQ
jgi:hypothetical protein